MDAKDSWLTNDVNLQRVDDFQALQLKTALGNVKRAVASPQRDHRHDQQPTI